MVVLNLSVLPKGAVTQSFSFVQPPLVCAVPLRGCGFEIPIIDWSDAEVWEYVSVPLRGCGFEMGSDQVGW